MQFICSLCALTLHQFCIIFFTFASTFHPPQKIQAMKITPTLMHNNVMLRVVFPGNMRKHIATGAKISSPDEWQDGFVVRRPDAARLNAQIASKLQEVQDALTRLKAQGFAITPESLSEELSDGVCYESFCDFMERRIEERELRPNSRRNHLIALAALRRYGKINSFASMNAANVAQFDAFLRREDKTRSAATIHGYHKSIKVYVNEAVTLGKIKETPYKFFKDRKPAPPERNPLTEEEINKIVKASLPASFEKAQDIFIFQAFTGLAYVDAMNFDASKHLVTRNGNSFVSFVREKTSTHFFTPILPQAEAIVLKYGNQLPRLSNQKYNMHLHAIAAIVGIDKPLTSHIARHSFATLMLSHDVPIDVVSKMLGHKDIAVTQLYAKVLEARVVESAGKLFKEL